MKRTGYSISLFIIFAFIYLIMCPSAQALTPDNASQVVIPQNHITENHCPQKDHPSPPLYFSKKSQRETCVHDTAALLTPVITNQRPWFGLSLIITSRLII
jgi:hypothetical protein